MSSLGDIHIGSGVRSVDYQHPRAGLQGNLLCLDTSKFM